MKHMKHMKHIILFMAAVCAVASFASFNSTRATASGANWATQLCLSAGDLCHRPLSFALAAAALASLWLFIALAAAFIK
jgi:hypothetical protein